MRMNKGPYSSQPMRQFGNARTDRLQKPGQFGRPMAGPKPMGQSGPNLLGRSPTRVPTIWEQWQPGGQQPFGLGGSQGGMTPGGGMQSQPSVTGPQGGIPGLPGYDPNANVQGIGGPSPQPVAQPEFMGPGDRGPDPFAGLSGSEIFALISRGQRP